MINTLAQIGGVFALLALLHFVADWVFQSHDEAMAKPTSPRVRARHCLIYTVICCVVIEVLGRPDWPVLGWIAGLLFCSHYLEDTYLPVYVWARYIRNPPEMRPPTTEAVGALIVNPEELGRVTAPVFPGSKEFLTFASTPLGKILLIAIDQIIHLVFLLPVAALLVLPQEAHVLILVGVKLLGLLAVVTLWGDWKLRHR